LLDDVIQPPLKRAVSRKLYIKDFEVSTRKEIYNLVSVNRRRKKSIVLADVNSN